MVQKFRSSGHRQRFFSLALLGCACAALPIRSVRAQTAASANVASNGINIIETSGVYPTTANGSNHYIDSGAGYTFPSYTVLDFTVGSFNLAAPVTSVSTLTLTVTEANFTRSMAGGFAIFLTEDTNSIATANGGSALTYQTANAPGGLGTQLGDPNAASPTLFQIGTFTSNASTTSTSTDTFTLTLSSVAQSYFTQELNAGSASDLRLVIASTDTKGYITFDGNTSAVTAANQPTLAFSAVLNQPTLTFTPGGTATGGSGTWLPQGTTGDTSWNGGGWVSTDTAVFAGTGGTVAIGGGGVTAAGIRFDVTGYTIGTTSGSAITLASTNGTSAPVIQVTNATDTATINAPLAGTTGFNKTGAGTLVLGGTNTYTGGTTITAGTLQVGTDANLGDASGGVTLAGGTLHPTASLATARAFSGSGGLQIDSGNTLSTSGVFNVANLTLTGAGTLALTNSSGSLASGASNAISGTLTFNTGGTTITTADRFGTGAVNGNGVTTLGGISATQTSGTATFASNLTVAGTVNVAVANNGATVSLPGQLVGAAVIYKTGAGTLVLGGDNSQLSGNGASFRLGTAGATPTAGGTVSIAAGNANPSMALGTAEFDANGGTLSNDSGQAISLPSSANISLGAQNAATTPGGLVFTGASAITVNGPISLYRGGTNAYQHMVTVNTPTTFTGMLSTTATTGTPQTGTVSLGLTFAGTSTLTLQGTAANTINVPITIATSGANAGVTAGADGTFAAVPAITLNAGAKLTLSTGATSGTVNAINDAALVSFASASGAFGKLALNIGTGQETVGGLYLATSDGTLPAGYQPAGTYGPTGSGATYIDNTLFSGAGVINNLGTAVAVPEPATWTLGLLGLGMLGWLRSRRAVRIS